MADGGIVAWASDHGFAGGAAARPAGSAEGVRRRWQLIGGGSPADLRETLSVSARVDVTRPYGRKRAIVFRLVLGP